MKAWMPNEPPTDLRRFMRTVVIQNQMDVEVGRHTVINRIEKTQELPTAMSAMALPNDASGRDVQRGKQRRGAVPHVIMCSALGLPRTHRQQRRRPIQCLNLTLFIDRQEQRASGWIEIQPDDVAHFVDEQRIFRELERIDPMRLQRKRLPDSSDGRLAHFTM